MVSGFIGNPSEALKSFLFHRHSYDEQNLFISYIDREVRISQDAVFLSGQIELSCDGYDDVTVKSVKLLFSGKDGKSIGSADLLKHFEDAPKEIVVKGFRNMRLSFKLGIKRELWETCEGLRATFKTDDTKGKSRLYRKADFHASEK